MRRDGLLMFQQASPPMSGLAAAPAPGGFTGQRVVVFEVSPDIRDRLRGFGLEPTGPQENQAGQRKREDGNDRPDGSLHGLLLVLFFDFVNPQAIALGRAQTLAGSRGQKSASCATAPMLRARQNWGGTVITSCQSGFPS